MWRRDTPTGYTTLILGRKWSQTKWSVGEKTDRRTDWDVKHTNLLIHFMSERRLDLRREEDYNYNIVKIKPGWVLNICWYENEYKELHQFYLSFYLQQMATRFSWAFSLIRSIYSPHQNINSKWPSISDLSDDKVGALTGLVYRIGQLGSLQPGVLRGLCHHRGELWVIVSFSQTKQEIDKKLVVRHIW